MNNNVKIFENPQFGEIRTAGDAENPMFCLADLCKVLELQVQNTKNRLKGDGVYRINLTDSLGREQQVLFVNEQNLYRVIMRSDKPQAEAFQDWVCGEVLPSIRKKGSYGNYDHLMAKLDFLERYLNVTNASTRERRLALKELGEAVGVTLPEDREDEQEGKHIKIEKGVYYSATILIKNLDTDYDNVRELNAELLWKGYLQNKEVKTKSGKYILNKVLTEKGLKYGKNIMSNYKGGTEQPRYTKEGFESLIMALNTRKQQ